MNKKEIYHLLKRYRYMVEAAQKGEPDVEIRISGRRESIKIDTKILTFIPERDKKFSKAIWGQGE